MFCLSFCLAWLAFMDVMFWEGALEADKQLAVLTLTTFSRIKLGNHVCAGKRMRIWSSAYLI